MRFIPKRAVYSFNYASEIIMRNIQSTCTLFCSPIVKHSPQIHFFNNYALCCCCRKLPAQIFTDAKPQIPEPPTQPSTESMKDPWVGVRTELCPFSSVNTCPYIPPLPLIFCFRDGKIWQISDTQLAKWGDVLSFSWPVQNLKQKCQKETRCSQHNMNFK